MSARVVVFRGGNGRWYFHRVAGNNRVTDASQGYRSKWNAKRAARKLWPDIPLVVV